MYYGKPKIYNSRNLILVLNLKNLEGVDISTTVEI